MLGGCCSFDNIGFNEYGSESRSSLKIDLIVHIFVSFSTNSVQSYVHSYAIQVGKNESE